MRVLDPTINANVSRRCTDRRVVQCQEGRLDEEGCGGALTIYDLSDEHGNVSANGVYLYVVTVKGWDGTTVRSEIRKLIVLR